ncbi:hypothetical protein TrRE_jg13628 [Triparma retinervis]|uniref:Bromo domain-containing protein n=1 Tax=Triparma retinervis TaxID=2557542 RepID=A0A9W7A3R6_9STRA|nr:hypothetical protein TrRE_jg13628 [Triparma retinervis]
MGSPNANRGGGANVRLLGSLRGHRVAEGNQSQGFDLAYANRGDRMLSFGTEECKVNVWSWGYRAGPAGGELEPDLEEVGRVVIWVKDPHTSAANTTGGQGQRYKTELNCVAWTCSDARIVTAQSTGARKDMERESRAGNDHHKSADRFNQFVRVWDSRTGDMISSIHAHTDKVAKIMPHPKVEDVLMTAGFDGYLCVWDVGLPPPENPVFEHKNSFRHGMVNNVPGDRYREHGEDVMAQYSEGDWSADGRGAVVGDHAGRFTIVDCFEERDVKARQRAAKERRAREGTLASDLASTRIDDVAAYDPPKWMKEQYFSTDYNDLSYDHSGYAVDTASGMPPHVAPRGGRTNHLMNVEQDGLEQDIAGRFGELQGPKTKDEDEAARERMETLRMRRDVGRHLLNEKFRGVKEVGKDVKVKDLEVGKGILTNFESSRAKSKGIVVDNGDTGFGQRSGQQRGGGGGRGGVATERRVYEELDSGDEMFNATLPPKPGEMLIQDDFEYYRDHIGMEEYIDRGWLTRDERCSSKKFYCPQVGESVVYIPRAHYNFFEGTTNTVHSTPAWEEIGKGRGGKSLPVVRCEIVGMEYKFNGQFATCKSPVAIVKLKITGIPKERPDLGRGTQVSRRSGGGRIQYLWPKPEFEDSTEGIGGRRGDKTFKVHWYLNREYISDFLVKMEIFVKRISDLEACMNELDTIEGPIVGSSYWMTAINMRPEVVDPALVPYKTHVNSVADPKSNEKKLRGHLDGSGVGGVVVSYKEGQADWELGTLAPWEIDITDERFQDEIDIGEVDVQRMDEALREKLGEMVEMEIGNEENREFVENVDLQVFADYETLVVVQMNLRRIRRRLASGYYCGYRSFAFDVDLMRTNSLAYNDSKSEIHKANEERVN